MPRPPHIADPRLCLGCGACAAFCDAIVMEDVEDTGLRPVLAPHITDTEITEARALCPVIATDYSTLTTVPDYTAVVGKTTQARWGAVTGIWEGYATDPDLRHQASSGGALTALGLYALERMGHHGVLHTGQSPKDPLRNSTRMSRDRADLMAALGSRYAPASVCDGLGAVETAPAPCTVIGKPVEIAGLRNAMTARPALAKKVGLSLSFFCAETPPTAATRALMARYGVDASKVQSLRYRGHGWPGFFTTQKAQEPPQEHLIYYDAWAFLQGFRPWATHLWPDGAGELADISCGDPWYETPDGQNPGFSLIVARSARGRQVVEDAIAAGYLTATPAETWKLEASQKGLLAKKGAVLGRRVAHRVLGLPVTRFHGLDLRPAWRSLPLRAKLGATIGTVRRIFKRGLWRAR